MDRERRKELQEQYRQVKTHMGVVQVKNTRSGKVFIKAYPNLKNKWLSIKMQLETGRFANAQLQADWRELGGDAFEYAVLEEKPTDKMDDVGWEVKQLEKQWLDKLQPYDGRGYNKQPDKSES